ERNQRVGAAAVGICAAERDGAIEARQRLLVAAGAAERHAKKAVRTRALRIERDRALRELDPLRNLPLLAARERLAIERLRGDVGGHRYRSPPLLAQHLVALRAPELAIVDVLPALEPRPAAGEMHDLGRALRGLLVPAFEPVPVDRQRADVVV